MASFELCLTLIHLFVFLIFMCLVDLTLKCLFIQDLIINSSVYSILLFPYFLWYALLSTVVLSAYFSTTP